MTNPFKQNTKSHEYFSIYSDCEEHCESCVSEAISSTQTAGINRDLRVKGYEFKKIGNKYAWSQYCNACKRNTVHRQLVNIIPEGAKERTALSKKLREKIIKLHKNRDSRFGKEVIEPLEVDHRVPRIRATSAEESHEQKTDQELIDTFMLLTRPNNLTKSRACESCVVTGSRGYDQIPWWYCGDEKFEGSCVGCFWYNPDEWKEKLINELYRIKKTIS
jgi:hypothetical protein